MSKKNHLKLTEGNSSLAYREEPQVSWNAEPKIFYNLNTNLPTALRTRHCLPALPQRASPRASACPEPWIFTGSDFSLPASQPAAATESRRAHAASTLLRNQHWMFAFFIFFIHEHSPLWASSVTTLKATCTSLSGNGWVWSCLWHTGTYLPSVFTDGEGQLASFLASKHFVLSPLQRESLYLPLMLVWLQFPDKHRFSS